MCQQNKYLPKKKTWVTTTSSNTVKGLGGIGDEFVIHLPSSYDHTMVWVICGRLNKFVHFIALPTKYAATNLAYHFSTKRCHLHGLPITITSDRDPLFLSAFWKELFKMQGTKLQFSIAYHPETDGQT